MKLKSIQCLRAVAAIGVILCHAVSFSVGAAGVDLFFVISGFIMGTVMVGRTPGEFLSARLWRIFPMLWICALPWTAFAFYLGLDSPERTISTFTLWPVFGATYEWPYLRPAWSLCYEMLFYFACTFALLTRAWVPVGLFIFCFVANQFYPTLLFGFLGYPLIFDFLMGLLIIKLPKNGRVGGFVALAAIVPLVLSPATLFQTNTIGVSSVIAIERVFWWGIPAAAIVYGALSLEGLFRSRILVLLGDASYSLYLTHLLVLTMISGWAGAVVAIPFGLGVHLWVERPIIERRARWRHERGSAVAPVRERDLAAPRKTSGSWLLRFRSSRG